MLNKSLILKAFLALSLIQTAHAQSAVVSSLDEPTVDSKRQAGRIDADLVGHWVGRADAKELCSAYAWRTERAEDGQYHLRYFDETQTLLDDVGFWWVDSAGQYYEFSTQTKDEPVAYRYQLSTGKVSFKNDASVDTTNGCDVAAFDEQKVN